LPGFVDCSRARAVLHGGKYIFIRIYIYMKYIFIWNIYLYVNMYIHTRIPYVCKLTTFVGFSNVVYVSRNCAELHWGMHLLSCACECTYICKFHIYLYINRVFQLSFTVAQLTQCSIEGYVYHYICLDASVYIYIYTTYTYLNRVSQYFRCRLL